MMKYGSAPTPRFPSAWPWFVDEIIPAWVKDHYSPKESWKGKPFTEADAHFFFKGIQELSELFTEDRPRGMPAYFQHPKFRSAYLLYFLPLQAAKFITLFQLHPQAIEATLQHGQKNKTLRILDLGAGPGTASLAFLLWLLEYPKCQDLPPIELIWLDTHRPILEDGKALTEFISNHFPKLRNQVTVKTHLGPWQNANSMISDLGETSLIFAGHIFNETSPKVFLEKSSPKFLNPLIEKAKGGGILCVEPAIRSSSQLLSQLRDQLLEFNVIQSQPSSIWGPCLHAGRCPLASGRDWCHFSIPIQIPGNWFRTFSRLLSSERQWLKFSYLWLSSKTHPAPLSAPDLRKVISDPMKTGKKGHSLLLLCEPNRPGRLEIASSLKIWRGDWVKKGSGWPPLGSQRS